MFSSHLQDPQDDLANRIRASALEDIRLNGILGLRVTRVARGAYCSVTQIYRHFGDRNGLIADVLAQVFDEITTTTIRRTLELLSAMTTITVAEFVATLPLPSSFAEREEALLRSQILAVATVNPELHERLTEITRRVWPQWIEACEMIEARLVPGESFDRRVVFIVLLNSNLFYNSLLAENAVTDDEYRKFLIDIFGTKNNSNAEQD